MKRWWEDFEAGETIVSHGRTLSAADFLAWAGIEHDYASIHFDEPMMESTPFGGRIAAGFIALNLSVGLFGQGQWDWYWPSGADETESWEDLRFTRPVFIGDTLRCRRRIDGLTASDPYSGRIVHDVEVLNQHDEVVMSGRETLRVARRPVDGA
ncbi:MAG TPA: MaoC/PaaZ C-terminal domain-containing protein [Acidimicrobiales bacterium]|jgi:acyl dehydratase|nr:MaoC/PaaZ C-terminal domain-containing protein [Acidimicrobiales bacterium]